jgi:hypothetical protein
MPLVSPADSTGVIGNYQNKLESRNCFGVVTLYLPIGPCTELSSLAMRH